MAGGLWPVVTDVPAYESWDFGGHPYGLEPLTLPAPGSWLPAAGGAAAAITVPARGGAADRASLVEEFGVPPRSAALPDDADQLYWFRWITGHQVCFILWQRIGRLMRAAGGGERDPAAAIAPLRHCVRGTCAMLQYTGSCPAGVYSTVIRPRMRLQHPAFSGSWAPDFWPVRDLLRGRSTAFAGVPGAEALAEAVELYRTVHEEVAERLVPDGRSLLRQAEVRSWNLPVMRLMYDNFFLTMRAAVAEDAVSAQLLRRLVAIARDVEINGLHPGGRPAARAEPGDAQFTELLAEAASGFAPPPARLREVTR
jgi:L-tyrosine peroxygenase